MSNVNKTKSLLGPQKYGHHQLNLRSNKNFQDLKMSLSIEWSKEECKVQGTQKHEWVSLFNKSLNNITLQILEVLSSLKILDYLISSYTHQIRYLRFKLKDLIHLFIEMSIVQFLSQQIFSFYKILRILLVAI